MSTIPIKWNGWDLTTAVSGGKGERLNRDEKDWVFVSDAHFTGQEREEMGMFLQFLESQEEGLGRLVILGDLFEFLFGFNAPARLEEGSFLPGLFPFPEYLPVFEALQRLAHHGIQITYIEGNHDFRLSSFFRDWFGIEADVYPIRGEERLGGHPTFIAHGDLSNPLQWKYRFYRSLVKNPVTYRLIQRIGPRLTRAIARRMSHESAQRYHAAGSRGMPSTFRSFARRKFMEGFDIVILGHSHFPEKMEEEVEGRRCFYFNVGDWAVHRSYLRFSPPDHFELSQFTGR
jgi:UDP-2,3-diacylglucosamine pyrophosphatase LpxH